MSKNSLGRFPSVRNNTQFQRRQSKDGNIMLSNKDQIPHIQSQKKIFEQQINTTQSQIAKKMQQKIRMRKASGSQNKLKESGKQLQTAIDYIADPIENLKQKIGDLWQNSQQIYDLLISSSTSQSRSELKQEILRQASFILCQVTKGQSVENVVLQKMRRKLQKMKCIKKCQQKQAAVKNMFDDRIAKLSLILRTR